MIKHECEKCKWEIKNDICFCEDCKDEEVEKAYNLGFEEAEKEFKNKVGL